MLSLHKRKTANISILAHSVRGCARDWCLMAWASMMTRIISIPTPLLSNCHHPWPMMPRSKDRILNRRRKLPERLKVLREAGEVCVVWCSYNLWRAPPILECKWERPSLPQCRQTGCLSFKKQSEGVSSSPKNHHFLHHYSINAGYAAIDTFQIYFLNHLKI